jgi:hypothetical protein
MLTLIDGDIIRYRCGFAAEKNYYLLELINRDGHREYTEYSNKRDARQSGERRISGVSDAKFNLWTRREVQPIDHCLQIVKESIRGIESAVREKFNADPEVRIFLSGKKNFREVLATSRVYKGNREDSQKPTYYKDIGNYLQQQWSAETSDGWEADDEISIQAYDAKEKGTPYLVVSNDKDLDQISGQHYDWITKEFYDVSPKQARIRLYEQLLSGDSTDNIPGLPGIGKGKAAKALEECKSPSECLEKCIKMYEEYKLIDWQEYLVEMANLVYILKQPGVKWSDTEEGVEFCTKYLSHSSAS